MQLASIRGALTVSADGALTLGPNNELVQLQGGGADDSRLSLASDPSAVVAETSFAVVSAAGYEQDRSATEQGALPLGLDGYVADVGDVVLHPEAVVGAVKHQMEDVCTRDL